MPHHPSPGAIPVEPAQQGFTGLVKDLCSLQVKLLPRCAEMKLAKFVRENQRGHSRTDTQEKCDIGEGEESLPLRLFHIYDFAFDEA
ncbi:hypothetical protein PHLCEN_2v11798 [Hermanssonia centrifuga]|uniref:Uncharacterized protein n=1 Tax=Hermanssonia centrifuga TaxID=98765 RepID=A0A2R6NJ10_9APHY|nr:hypothetical protein PHLCEN_2v11798 [Hermanssonia centrifuga]